MSCRQNLHRSQESARSFRLQGYRTLIVTGGDVGYPEKLGFNFDGDVLSLPVPDDYEHLGSKVFYAYLILDLLGKPASIVKLDDDISLHDSDRFEQLLQQILGATKGMPASYNVQHTRKAAEAKLIRPKGPNLSKELH